MNQLSRKTWITLAGAGAIILVGQLLAYLVAPLSWQAFAARLPVIFSMIAFWGPMLALMAALVVWITLRLVGFRSLDEIRIEAIEQNNPTPAIIFVGALIASILFFMLIIRP